MRLSTYPAYKSSGVAWLEEVPDHWNVLPIKRLEKHASYLAQTGPFGAQLHASDYEDEGVPLILIKHVNNLMIYDDEMPHVSTEKAKQLSMYMLKPGDIVFSRVGSVGRIALTTEREKGWLISGQMLRLRIKNSLIYPRYLVYVISSPNISRYFELSSLGSTRDSINTEILRNMSIILPPQNEQHAIASFLDRETERIDKLIAKKEQLVELLQEKRTALISNAVTKGLEPSVPMKDSGVEWIGKIPEHWEVKQLKRLASLRAGFAITSESIEELGEYPVFGGNGIRGFTSSYTHEGELPLIGRQGALCGCVNFAHGRFWASEHAVVATPEPEVDTHWLMYLLRAMSLNTYSQSAAQPGLAVETISALQVCMPFITEQSAIAAVLDREIAKIDTLSSKIQNTIAKLREFRSALISAAVTGKIDVRQEAA